MDSKKRTARVAGVLYLLMSVLAIFGYMVIPARFIVPGNAAATAQRIMEGAVLYRVSILTGLAGQILFLLVALTLYRLFRDVDRVQARLMLVLVCVGVAAEIVVLAMRTAPLVLLSGDAYLSPFTRPQLESLAFGFLRLGSSLGRLIMMIWGLWLFPFGVLTIRSRLFPRVLGVLLFVSGFAYVVTSVTSIVFPDQLGVVSRFMTPLYFGELAMVLWLPIFGAREPARTTQPVAAS